MAEIPQDAPEKNESTETVGPETQTGPESESAPIQDVKPSPAKKCITGGSWPQRIGGLALILLLVGGAGWAFHHWGDRDRGDARRSHMVDQGRQIPSRNYRDGQQQRQEGGQYRDVQPGAPGRQMPGAMAPDGLKPVLDKLVAAGTLTQAQEDAILNAAQAAQTTAPAHTAPSVQTAAPAQTPAPAQPAQ